MAGDAGLIAIGAGIAIGLSALAAAWAESAIGTEAVGAMAEKENLFGKGSSQMAKFNLIDSMSSWSCVVILRPEPLWYSYSELKKRPALDALYCPRRSHFDISSS